MIKTKYNGWEVYSFTSGCLTIYVAPQLGGRIIQVEFDGSPMLFVNPLLEGAKNTQGDADWDGVWQNFGGEKVWVAPQGWDNCQQWAGPPDPVLDGGNYAVTLLGEDTIALQSPVDPRTGLQIDRTISLEGRSSTIGVSATFTNRCEQRHSWSVWPVVQVAAPQCDGSYSVVVPLNSGAKGDSFKIMHGLVNTPQVSMSAGNAVVDFQYLVGKVGADSPAGWVAYCNRNEGKVLVVKYDYDPEGEYPDQTSVQVWTQGMGTVYSRGAVRSYVDDKTLNPPYMEMELLSPLRDIEPGGQMDFSYRMCAATITNGLCVTNVGLCSVTAAPLSCTTAADTLSISGEYGFFCNGTLELEAVLHSGVPRVLTRKKVYPQSAATLCVELSRSESEGVCGVRAMFYNEQNQLIEQIDNIEICRI